MISQSHFALENSAYWLCVRLAFVCPDCDCLYVVCTWEVGLVK